MPGHFLSQQEEEEEEEEEQRGAKAGRGALTPSWPRRSPRLSVHPSIHPSVLTAPSLPHASPGGALAHPTALDAGGGERELVGTHPPPPQNLLRKGGPLHPTA